MAKKQSKRVKDTKVTHTFAVEVQYEGNLKKPTHKQLERWLSACISKGETPPQTLLLRRTKHPYDVVVVGQNRVFFTVRSAGRERS